MGLTGLTRGLMWVVLSCETLLSCLHFMGKMLHVCHNAAVVGCFIELCLAYLTGHLINGYCSGF